MIELLLHQLKEKKRSSIWSKSIVLNIMLSLIVAYLLLNITVASYFADSVIASVAKGQDVARVFSGFMFYYLLTDLTIRFIAQELPALSIQPYLTLPVKKPSLLQYLLVRSIFSFFNVIGLLVILPFTIKTIFSGYGTAFGISWLITFIALIIANNYLNFLLKKQFIKRPLAILLIILGFTGLVCIDLLTTISVADYFTSLIFFISANGWLCSLPVALAALFIFASYKMLLANVYLDDLSGKSENRTSFLSGIKRFDDIFGLEPKLILRNKRPRSLAVISILFLLYGLVFYTDQHINNYFFLTFTGLFVTGTFLLNYGQFMYAWEGSFFDFYLVNNISTHKYISNKLNFFAAVTIINYLVTLPYAFIDFKLALINLSLAIYCFGVNSFLLLYLNTYNTKALNLSSGSIMNYQGIGVLQYLLVLPLFALPILIVWLFSMSDKLYHAYYLLAFMGFMGIILQKQLTTIIANQLKRQKHRIASGFRNK